MKIYRKNVSASVSPAKNSGTTFYSASAEDIIDAYRDETLNVWVRKAFIEEGLDAIDFDHNLFGSKVIDDMLFICVTDGQDIEVNGELVNPEEALEIFTPDELLEYTRQASKNVIRRYITEYEIKIPDFDNWAVDLLNDGYDFSKLVKDYQEFE
ncbi:MAG: hypothetical protein NC548_47050 [Lachnospiraceae bacterium]|nr:hypothetical protein [Lachnospiraceae bacterium]